MQVISYSSITWNYTSIHSILWKLLMRKVRLYFFFGTSGIWSKDHNILCYQWSGALKGPSHIQNGARPTSLRAKKRIFARMTAGVCSITAGSAAIFRDRPAFAGHRNLFLIQRFSNGRISDLRNMTCTYFRCPIYASSGRRRTPGRTSGGARARPSVGRVSAGVDRLTNYRPNSEGARPYIDRASHDSR